MWFRQRRFFKIDISPNLDFADTRFCWKKIMPKWDWAKIRFILKEILKNRYLTKIEEKVKCCKSIAALCLYRNSTFFVLTGTGFMLKQDDSSMKIPSSTHRRNTTWSNTNWLTQLPTQLSFRWTLPLMDWIVFFVRSSRWSPISTVSSSSYVSLHLQNVGLSASTVGFLIPSCSKELKGTISPVWVRLKILKTTSCSSPTVGHIYPI